MDGECKGGFRPPGFTHQTGNVNKLRALKCLKASIRLK